MYSPTYESTAQGLASMLTSYLGEVPTLVSVHMCTVTVCTHVCAHVGICTLQRLGPSKVQVKGVTLSYQEAIGSFSVSHMPLCPA